MAKASNQAPPEKVKRRRTEDEMRKALTVIQAKRAELHVHRDDEHVEVIADVVNELLAMRELAEQVIAGVSMMGQKVQERLNQI